MYIHKINPVWSYLLPGSCKLLSVWPLSFPVIIVQNYRLTTKLVRRYSTWTSCLLWQQASHRGTCSLAQTSERPFLKIIQCMNSRHIWICEPCTSFWVQRGTKDKNNHHVCASNSWNDISFLWNMFLGRDLFSNFWKDLPTGQEREFIIGKSEWVTLSTVGRIPNHVEVSPAASGTYILGHVMFIVDWSSPPRLVIGKGICVA